MAKRLYYQNLVKRVLDASTIDNWDIAVQEWDIVDCEEDEKCSSGNGRWYRCDPDSSAIF